MKADITNWQEKQAEYGLSEDFLRSRNIFEKGTFSLRDGEETRRKIK